MDNANVSATGQPEYNTTGQDFSLRGHFRYTGPLIDVHAHVTRTPAADPLGQAETMLSLGQEFGIARTYSMCAPEDIPPLRERFGTRIAFNGPIAKKQIDEPDDAVYQRLEQFLNLGVEIIKLWSAPRGRPRGLLVDAPWRIEAVRRAQAAGVRVIMVHVADPDIWFARDYQDASVFGTKRDQYPGLQRMLELFPDLTWIAAHMGGDPEHADHLQALLEKYPHLHIDTSATRWQVREVSAHRDAIRSLVCRFPQRFLFGSDLVTRGELQPEHYVSRYWCQRTLWESNWEGPSPIFDPDYQGSAPGPSTPMLRGLNLPAEVLKAVYYDNACRVLPASQASVPG